MEPEVVKVERRGRKRKRKDVQTAGVDGEPKRGAVETRSKALVGSYVRKEFEGSGVYIGKVVYYDRGLYRIVYEDGDCEDLESGELRQFLIRIEADDKELLSKKGILDELILKKYENEKRIKMENKVETNVASGAEASSLSELSNCGTLESNGVQAEDDADSSSDSCEYAIDGVLSSEAEALLVPPPELPPSSGTIGVPDESVADLLSVYSFVRSYSVPLFLSPFALEDFVGALNCSVQNTLLDAIHVALMRTLRRHFETLSADGSELASKCLRSMDWNLIDSLTWPVFVVQYLMMMGYTEGLEWKGYYIDALQKDYYLLSVSRKLRVLQILCDDALDSAELRAEIDMREESEGVVDSEGIVVSAAEVGPRRVHPRFSKTSACKDQEVITERRDTKSSCNSSSNGHKSTRTDTGADLDQDGNSDECRLCGMDGTLLCCDGCPSAYHSRCIGVSKMSIPEGEWYCTECAINKIGPAITPGTSLRGAEFFGVDPYEQVFLGSCDHLLVIQSSTSSEPCIRYYHQKDIAVVLQALLSVQHFSMYSELCERIVQYWEIPVDIKLLTEKYKSDKSLASEMEDGRCHTPALPFMGKDGNMILEKVGSESLASCIAESKSEKISSPEIFCKEPWISKACRDTMTQYDHPINQQSNNDCIPEQASSLGITKSSEQVKMEATMSSGSVSQQPDPSDLSQLKLAGMSDLTASATLVSHNDNSSNRGDVNGTRVTTSMPSQGKVANCQVSQRGYGNGANGCIYMGSNFKAQAYINHYIHGDFAASAAANLAILSSDDIHVSDSNASDHYRKVMAANVSLQTKAFSSATSRFFWPNTEKKLMEVPRERCGWCLSCKAPVQSKRGCYLNAAVSSSTKGTMKILAGIRPLKNGDGSLYSIATYMMFMEKSLRGLIVGPFMNSTYRKQWCKEAEQVSTCREIKSLLLKLEENIRIVALSGDWVKLVDGWTPESSVILNMGAVGSNHKRGPGRRGRKQSTLPEITGDDDQDISDCFIWWRGGMLSKFIMQKGILPRKMVKKSARQGGSRKIPSIYYAEGVEVPKRTRRFVWRAAVEMSKNMSQLAAQIRYLDIHVRWGDLVRPEQSPPEGKGAETEASAFRNAFICDKQIVDNKCRYAVAFGNQKHLPSRIMKSVIEVGKSEDGTEKYWFLESRVPLYLIKEYEEKMDKVPSPPAEKNASALSKLQRRQLKNSRKDIFSYLTRKRDKLDTCRCASCQLDVFLGNAVKCSKCEGYCHASCTISSTVHMNVEVEFIVTCKSCYQTEAKQNEKNNVSPTTPLHPQREDTCALAVSKGGNQNVCNRALVSNGAPNRSSGKRSSSNGSSLRPKKSMKLCSWGLIWKKKNCEDTGIDFRLTNILLKGNPNLSEVECDLCKKPYSSDLMYICCETCKKWYHADAVELEESKILELLGFKCCKCRRIRSPVCPYTDPDRKISLEGKKPYKRAPKQGSLVVDSNLETTSEQPIEREPDSVVLPTKKELVCIKGEKPLTFSISRVEHVTNQTSEVGFELNSASLTGSGPQKLPVRRHLKREDDLVGSSANNPSADSSTLTVGNVLPPADESLSPWLEWDIPTNEFEDGLMFDYESLNYDDMECEPPQTYFSFTELLASDDGDQLDGVDPSGNIIQNMENSSVVSQDGNLKEFGVNIHEECTDSLEPAANLEEYGISFDPQEHTDSLETAGYLEQYGISIDQQEYTDSLEPNAYFVPCGVCSETEPNPDRCCQICRIWIHSHCSPWVESSSYEDGSWICGTCRGLC